MLAAWELLETEKNPAAADREFRDVIAAESASRAVRGEALVGRAQALRLLGRTDEARDLVRRARADFSDIPVVARRLDRFGASLDEKTTFVTDITAVRSGSFLDLDTGAILSARSTPFGQSAEIGCDDADVRLLVDADESAAGDPPQTLGGGRWRRLTTSGGRRAFVEILRGAPDAVVRYVVRLSGTGDPLAPPAGFRTVGDGQSIAIHFTTDAAYARYRIERRGSPDAAFEIVGETPRSPWIDAKVDASEIYEYRLVGITAEGDEGVGRIAVGSARVSGIFSGTIALPLSASPGDGVDLLRKKVVPARRSAQNAAPAAHSDLRLAARVGEAGFYFDDTFGGPALSGAADHLRLDPWRSTPEGTVRTIVPGRRFVVGLRTGGAAICVLRIEKNEYVIEFEADPVDPAFDRKRPYMHIAYEDHGDERDAVVKIEPPEGGTIGAVKARDADSLITETLRADGGIVRIRRRERNSEVDLTIEAKDELGRRFAPGRSTIDFVGAGERREGEFEFVPGSGYSFARRAVVRGHESRGFDLWFVRGTGRRIYLSAPGGIIVVDRATRANIGPRTPPDYLAAVAGIDLSALHPAPEADLTDADFFFVHTRSGGWIKAAIIDRPAGNADSDSPSLRIQWIMSGLSPRFVRTGESFTRDGIIYRRDLVNDSAAVPPAPIEERSPATVAADELRARAAMLDACSKNDTRVSGVLSRAFFPGGSDENAGDVLSIRFEERTAADPGAPVPHVMSMPRAHGDGPAHFVFGPAGRFTNAIRLRHAEDDRSVIARIGTFAVRDGEITGETPESLPPETRFETVVEAQLGALYAMHVRTAREDFWVRFQIIDMKPGREVLIRWRFERSPQALQALDREGRPEIAGNRLRLAIRGGTGGGIRRAVTLDGRLEHVDLFGGEPFPDEAAAAPEDPCSAFVDGGYIPAGKVFQVRRVRVRAIAGGDSNGPGEATLDIGPYRILRLRSDEEHAFSALAGEVADAQPITREFSTNILIPSGRESGVRIAIRNTSLIDVTIEGRLTTLEELADVSGSNFRRVSTEAWDFTGPDDPRVTRIESLVGSKSGIAGDIVGGITRDAIAASLDFANTLSINADGERRKRYLWLRHVIEGSDR